MADNLLTLIRKYLLDFNSVFLFNLPLPGQKGR